MSNITGVFRYGIAWKKSRQPKESGLIQLRACKKKNAYFVSK